METNYSQGVELFRRYLAEKLTKRSLDRSYNSLFAAEDINYPGICELFIASIQANTIMIVLERWWARKPSHVKYRIDFNGFENMDKAASDDSPSSGTIFPVRG